MIRLATNAVNAGRNTVSAAIAAVKVRLQAKWNVDMLYTCMNTMRSNQARNRGTALEQPFNYNLFERMRAAAAQADKLRAQGNHKEANDVALAAYAEYVKS